MRNKRYARRFPAAALALAVLCVGLSAWGVSGEIRVARLNRRIDELENASLSTGAAPEASLSDAQLSAAAAEFDGGTVTVAEAIDEYNMIAAYYEMMGMDEAEYAENAKYTVLDGLIEEKILENKAKEMGVYELNEQQKAEIAQRVQAEYEDNIEYYKAFRYEEGKSDAQVREETIAYLNENGYSYEKMLENAQKDAWRDQLYDAVTRDMTVSEDQLREFYESQVASAQLAYSADFSEYEMDFQGGRAIVWHPEGVRRVEAIQIGFDEEQGVEYLTLQATLEGGDSSGLDALEALYGALEPRAQEALNRAAAGEDFHALMDEYGAADISCVAAQSTFSGDAFRDAAMALAQPGDISGLVQTDGGICIIRYVEDVPAGQVAYEEVKDALLVNYEAELKSSLYNATVLGWIEEANVQYHLDRF